MEHATFGDHAKGRSIGLDNGSPDYREIESNIFPGYRVPRLPKVSVANLTRFYSALQINRTRHDIDVLPYCSHHTWLVYPS